MKFSLRTLLIVVALGQVPLISYVYLRSRVARESEAVEAILGDLPGKVNRGAHVLFLPNNNSWRATNSPTQNRAAALGIERWLFGITALEADRRNLDADSTSRLADLGSLQYLRLRYATFDQSAAMPGASFPKLRFLDLRGSAPSEPLMATIGRSHALADLRLNDCTLPAESLNHLGGLKELTILRLCRANIHQENWAFLRALDKLECLMARDVSGSAIPIYKLPLSLQRCDVSGSKVDFSGVPETLTNLRVIDFSRTEIDLSDLFLLIPKCPKLEGVGIMQGDLEPAEVRSIKTAFPKLEIFESPQTNVIPTEVE
jgi:hypothetical protein